ncbi:MULTISPECIES: hypothetical protein [unclassified Paenibacillus]|uniref:hypothetical protein n=1 Tax=unclassified Paenibacillus TaxID=185978 RepID=UPI000956DC88|nr:MULTISPECIES: hypothetical protein [unclassified Paenibacillus]ASS66480.1 hypothetical protein CIC07_10185 [Paenibacillus sp. RUD330]SIQ03093.1 hypothetical protein SAMN05880555_0382 [Paenibacillus sp. RU4X]SIQ22756.1 hypothetical protein SAMN05880570_0382 [Paenibacillus sp. RU4T]
MARQNKDENGVPEEQAAYGKEQLLASELYFPLRDLLTVLLEDGASYTKEQVAEKVDQFMKREAV